MTRGPRAMTGLVGLFLSVAVVAGCGDDGTSGADPDPAATGPATSGPTPVFPTGGTDEPTGSPGPDGGYDACELLPPDDLEQVTGLSEPETQPSDGLCGYTVDGQTVFRVSLLTYPQATGAEQVLEATVSSFESVEDVSDVGDAAAYVPDAGFGPSLFVVVENGQQATVLTLAFDSDTDAAGAPESKDQLIELGGIAAGNV